MARWRSLARARLEDGHTQGRDGEADDIYSRVRTRLIGPFIVATIFFRPEQPGSAADFWCPSSKMDFTVRVGPDLWPVGFRYPSGAAYSPSVPRVLIRSFEPVRTNACAMAKESDLEVNSRRRSICSVRAKTCFGRGLAVSLRMFGGVSTEVLWYPMASRLALGRS